MKEITKSLISGFLLLAMIIIMYFTMASGTHSDKQTRAITFSALIIGNVFLILSSLSKNRSFIHVFTDCNYAAISIISTAILVLFFVLTVPTFQQIFRFEFPGSEHYQTLFALGFSLLFLLESRKIAFIRNFFNRLK